MKVMFSYLFIALFGCTTTPNAEMSNEELSQKIGFACVVNPEVLLPQYKILDCTLSNATESDQNLEVSELKFPTNTKSVEILSADEIVDFEKKYKERVAKQKSSQKTFVLSSLVAGAAVAAGRGEFPTGAVGVGATVVISKNAAHEDKKVQGPKGSSATYSNQHLLGTPLLVKAQSKEQRKLFVKILQPTKLPKDIEMCLKQPQTVCLNSPVGQELKGKQYW